MKIKNKDWIDFKVKFLEMLDILGEESENFNIPEDIENFIIYVKDCEVHPIFMKKDEFLKVEYDLTLCDTKIRTLSFSMYRGAARVEMTMKDNNLK